VDWIGLSCSYECHSCSHTFACHSIFGTDDHDLTGSIPSELGELTLLTYLTVGKWIGLDWFILFVWMSQTLAYIIIFACRSVPPGSNLLTGSIPTELSELTLLTVLWLSTYIDLIWFVFCWHEWMSIRVLTFSIPFCSIIQVLINSRVQFRTNSENWRCWIHFTSVRTFSLVYYLVRSLWMSCMHAHIFFPFYNMKIWTDENDLTGDLDPIFCDASIWQFWNFYSDCSSEVVCTCCTKCY
jgi:hypothetical protein